MADRVTATETRSRATETQRHRQLPFPNPDPESRIADPRVRAARLGRAVDGRGRGGGGDRGPSAARRHPPRSQRLARHLLARAAGGGGDTGRSHRLRARGDLRRREPLRGGLSRPAARIPFVWARRRSIPYLAKQERLTFARVGVIDPWISTTTSATADSRTATGADDDAGRDRPGRHRLGPARPRRRGVSDGHQVEDGARSAGRSEVRRLQRRRGRLGDVLRPDADGRRSLRAHRGHDDRRRSRWARRRATSICASSTRTRRRALEEAIAAASCGGLPRGRRAEAAAGVRPRAPHRRRRLHLRRRNLDARKPRRQTRRSTRSPAAARGRRALRAADGGQQRHLARKRADHSREGRGLLSRLRHGAIARHAADPARGQHQARRPRRESVRRHAARAALRLRRRLGLGPAHPRGAGRRAARARTCPSRSSTRRSTTRRSTQIGALLGHGGIVVFDDTVDMAAMARYAMEFCAHESCGKCTPCRIGSTRGVEMLDGRPTGPGSRGRTWCCSTNSARRCCMGRSAAWAA